MEGGAKRETRRSLEGKPSPMMMSCPVLVSVANAAVPTLRLDRKWLLWRDFLKEHAHLETWLRSTEQALTCAGPAHITYVSAKEKLRRMEVSWI